MQKIVEMANLIKHRGPDDEGFCCLLSQNNEFQSFCGNDSYIAVKNKLKNINNESFTHDIAFAHRRYAVIDLSENGHEPKLQYNCALIFNGEIYNYIELKIELQKAGYIINSNSDTDVILPAYKHWGLDCFKHFRGIFAIVIYDFEAKKIVIARDHIGKIPLYYIENERGFFFASDIKPLLVQNDKEKKNINEKAIYDYLVYGVRDYKGQTFWQNINCFRAGSISIIEQGIGTSLNSPYWELPSKRLTKNEISFEEATTTFTHLLNESFLLRLRADLKVGFTLSGGLDSSTLVALFAKNFPNQKAPVYTVMFDNEDLNEEPIARKLIEKYPNNFEYNVVNGLNHTLIEAIDYFFNLEEEPFLSPNIYTENYIMQQLKKQGIGININGAGADELLAGYVFLYQIPYLNYLFENDKHLYFETLEELWKFYGTTTERLAWLKHYFSQLPIIHDIRSKIRDKIIHQFTNFSIQNRKTVAASEFNQRMKDNFSDYIMNYWFCSGNKHYMGIPMEPRNPFLDVRLAEFCFQLPPEYLIHNGWHKYILRKSAEPLLPPEITWRKYKMGFPFDDAAWLKTHKNHLIDIIKNHQIPYIDVQKVCRNYDRLLQLNEPYLWRLICYAIWYIKMIKP